MKTVKYSCKGCDKRFPGCHDECEAYQNEKESQEAQQQKLKDAKQRDSEYYGYQVNKTERIRRREFDRTQKRSKRDD